MKTIGAEINGVHTDIAIKQYANCLFLIITQTGKIRNCIQVEKETAADPFLPTESQSVYNCAVKFGPDSLEDLAAIQYLSEKVQFPKNTVVSIGLVDSTPPILSAVAEILQKHKSW